MVRTDVFSHYAMLLNYLVATQGYVRKCLVKKVHIMPGARASELSTSVWYSYVEPRPTARNGENYEWEAYVSGDQWRDYNLCYRFCIWFNCRLFLCWSVVLQFIASNVVALWNRCLHRILSSSGTRIELYSTCKSTRPAQGASKIELARTRHDTHIRLHFIVGVLWGTINCRLL
jgi:hypothetical protein